MISTVSLAQSLYRDQAASRADVLEAEALLAGVLKTMRRALGPTHPITLDAVDDLEIARKLLSRKPP